jgi:competence protein ComEA
VSGIIAESRRKPPHRHAHNSHRAKKPKHPPILNLNQASSAQLQLLPGIGPKMAERILEYRRTHGRFAEPAQIMEVKGIGPRKFEKLKPYLKI